MFLTNIILNNTPGNVYALTRKKNNFNIKKLKYLNKNFDTSRLRVIEIDYQNYNEILKFFEDLKPNYIFNMMGPSSVNKFINSPNNMKNITIQSFDNLTNSLIETKNFCNFYQASSSEMFGHQSNKPLDESSTFSPNSPYAEAKLRNHKKALELSKKYDWNIFSGIMFNHESQFREDGYLFMKIINGAIDIKNKKLKKLTVGSLDYVRDWSFAGDISKAIYAITNKGSSNAYVIGSGKGNSIKTVIEIIFDYFNLNLDKYIDVDETLIRKGDPVSVVSNPKKLNHELGWNNIINFEDLIQICIESKINKF